MPTVKFTNALKRFYPDLKEVQVSGITVARIIKNLDFIYPNISTYIVDEQGALRQHVNIFVQNEIIEDKKTLKDIVTENDEVYIIQALSGG